MAESHGLERKVAWGAFGVAVLVNAAGYALGLWSLIGWYDKPVHAYTIFAMTLLLGSYLLGPVVDGSRPFVAGVLLAAAGLGIGAVWELVEYGLDTFFPSPAIALAGLDDAMLDLLFDLAGSVVAAAGLMWWRRHRREI